MFSISETVKRFTIFLIFCLVPLFAQDISWYNTTDKVFELSKAEQLKGLASLVNGLYPETFAGKTILLVEDIDLKGEGFIPIGINSATNYFSGIFDGQGHTISRFSVNEVQYAGLFGYVKGGQIKNVKIAASEIKATATDKEAYAGGLVGYASKTPISNSHASGNISASGTSTNGGLVGYADSMTISNSHASGNVSAGTTNGGLVGYANETTISNSYASGGVSTSSPSTNGGLVGHASKTTISSSHASGDVSNSYDCNGYCSGVVGYSGGLVGYAIHTTISDSYAHGDVSAFFSLNSVGGLVGYAINGYNNSIYTTISNSYATGNVSSFNSGGLVGSAGLKVSITDCYASGNISGSISGGLVGNVNGGYYGGSWIGDGTTTISNSYASGNVSGSYGYGCGSSPLCNSDNRALGGLAGNVGSTTNITNSYASGSVSGSGSLGGLVGNANNATIYSSYAIGYVSPKSSDTRSGGLVGNASNTTISSSYASGNVSSKSSDTRSGGLVGNASSTTISSSYASGNVLTEASGSYSGGLVGYSGNELAIKNSYASGDVSSGVSSSYSGGLVGYTSTAINIANSYASGAISGSNSYFGGIFGRYYLTGSTMLSVYYNFDKVSPAAGIICNAGGVCSDASIPEVLGKSNADLKKQTTFTNWDFAKIWGINDTINNGYPYLRWSICLAEGKIYNDNDGTCQTTTPIRIPQLANHNIRIKAIGNAIMLSNLPQGATVELYNIQGKRIYFGNSENSQILRILVQTKGMYIATIQENRSSVKVKTKVVVR